MKDIMVAEKLRQDFFVMLWFKGEGKHRKKTEFHREMKICKRRGHRCIKGMICSIVSCLVSFKPVGELENPIYIKYEGSWYINPEEYAQMTKHLK